MGRATVRDATPHAIADFWLTPVEATHALAEAYGVDVVFVWQPAIIFKDTLSESEQAIYQRTENERPGLFALYGEVDAIVRERIANQQTDVPIVILSDLFTEESTPIFHDLVHITEIGNERVAQALIEHVDLLLED
ncbi:MAG: hypothetical protein ACFE0Q_06370 [Anaerolineae bacterium]